MIEKKQRKKKWKKHPKCLQGMINISIFANKSRKKKQQNIRVYELLNITINMLQKESQRDLNLENKFVKALTKYVDEHNTEYEGAILEEIASDKQSIDKIWRSFFKIAIDDIDNYKNVCKSLNNICTDKGLEVNLKCSWEINSLECYFNSIFHVIAPEGFIHRGNGECKNEFEKRMKSYCSITKKSDGKRYSFGCFYGAISKIEKAIQERNESAHEGKALSTKPIINAFFASTVIYERIKGVGCSFCVKDKNYLGDINISVRKKKDNTIIYDNITGKKGIGYVVIKPESFDNSNELDLEIKIKAAGCYNTSITVVAKLGDFSGENLITLKELGKHKNDRPSAELKENDNTLQINRQIDSLGHSYNLSTSDSQNVAKEFKELNKALHLMTGSWICCTCGNRVQKDVFDKETLRCFNCVNTALSLIEEGDNYVKASRIKSNDLKDLNSAVESYKEALNYSSKEQKYDVNSKLGHCYFLLQKYSDAINAFVHAGNNPMGLFYLGKCYQEGKGVNKDPEKAFGYFKKAADLGHAESQEFVATQYYEGKDLEQDYKLAFDYFKKAADQGIVNAQYMTGMMCKNGQGQDKNDDNAYIYFLKAADGKNLKAQYELATLLLEGKVVKHDEEGAFKWYLNAADQGLPEAMLKVAQMYRKKSNYEPALEWYRKTVEAKAPNAEKELLETLVKRAMLAHDFGEFEYELKLYLEAAGMGDENHYRNIADLYYKKEYNLKDDKKAEEWYLKAISKGDVSANIPLGDIYFNKMDLNNAETCFRKALNAGFNDAKIPLAILLNKRANTLLGYDVSGKSDSFDKTILNKVIVK